MWLLCFLSTRQIQLFRVWSSCCSQRMVQWVKKDTVNEGTFGRRRACHHSVLCIQVTSFVMLCKLLAYYAKSSILLLTSPTSCFACSWHHHKTNIFPPTILTGLADSFFSDHSRVGQEDMQWVYPSRLWLPTLARTRVDGSRHVSYFELGSILPLCFFLASLDLEGLHT